MNRTDMRVVIEMRDRYVSGRCVVWHMATLYKLRDGTWRDLGTLAEGPCRATVERDVPRAWQAWLDVREEARRS